MPHRFPRLADARWTASFLIPSLVSVPAAAWAQTPAPSSPVAATVLPTLTVTAAPLAGDEAAQILAPAKVLAGDELRDKAASTVGETLAGELGVSASGFGPGASRPIIRGLEGPRVQILQNGMAVGDVSSISNDHAVGVDMLNAAQVEVLRGPAALRYGSGASGGLVNVVNERIASELPDRFSALADAHATTVDQGKAASAVLDGAAGSVAWHLDAAASHAGDIRIPGYRELGGPTAGWALKGNTTTSGTLPYSYSRERTLGAGASYIAGNGHTGVSFEQIQHDYGIPSFDGARIEQTQNRVDVDHLRRAPLAGFETLRFKLAYTDYRHTERETDGTPAAQFLNQAYEGRLELTHVPVAGWRGLIGMQASSVRFSATDLSHPGHAAIIPPTRSDALAAFAVEQRAFGAVTVDLGARLEQVGRRPDAGVPYADTASFSAPAAPVAQARSFGLFSWSAGAQWAWMPAHTLGLTYSVAQRAPSPEELYSYGVHDATATFDVGNVNFQKETANNLELSLQRIEGPLRWKLNVYENHIRNFIYGAYPGLVDANSGDPVRVFSQQAATLRGAEAEISWRWREPGWSARVFTDTVRGSFDGGGSLPLQPATRVGVETGYRRGPLRAGMSAIHALRQDQLASFETAQTPAYTRIDANFSYTQKFGQTHLTWYAVGRNLLNQDIRYATTVETLRLYAPQPGRGLLVGVRMAY